MSKSPTAELDPRALIAEAYRIEGIGPEECRTIFFNWALGTGPGRDMATDVLALLAHYEPDAPDHPMTSVLREGLCEPRRRPKGARGR